MGIEAVKLNRAQYRKRRRTMGEMDRRKMTWTFVLYCLKQGAWRGCAYGAVYGILGSWYGILCGGAYGLSIGAVVGLLNGVVISAINAIQSQRTVEERYFLRTVARVSPVLTLIATHLALCIPRNGWAPNFTLSELTPNALFDYIPSLIAAFAAWQAARKMGDWYFE
ncbi:MAG: hypothetical protein JWQ02_959 [Capsulimonas sp.]|jgi:hypothetical protein|nr:hypothetical protein [Capsulimonas sp.]